MGGEPGSVAGVLVLYHGDAGSRQRARFEEVGRAHDLRIEVCAPTDVERFEALLPEVEVWWHVLTPIDAAQMDRAPRLRLIHKWGVGVNTIDLGAAAARGVAVTNMPGSNAAAVTESALLLMLSVLRRLPTHHRATVEGSGWQVPVAVGEQCGELAGRTVGLVGYGDIGQRLASVLTALGATVVHHSRRSDRPGWMPLDDLLAAGDVVSLHVPLTPETDGLLDERRIGLLRPGAVLVNTARGGLVDLDALDAALAAGRLGGAGLDVFGDEPHRGVLDHPIFARPEVVATPHVAWLTWETLERSLDLAVANAVALRAGEALADRVV